MSDAPSAPSAPSAAQPSAPAASSSPSSPPAHSQSQSPKPAVQAEKTFAPRSKSLESAEPSARSGTPAVSAPDSKFSESDESEAPAAKATETTAEKKARLLKLKVYGQERDFDVDNTPDEELTKYLQKGYAADKAFQEKAETERQAKMLIQAFAADPFEAYKQLNQGKDLMEMARERLIKEYEEQALPPADREKLQLQRQLDEYRQREEAQRHQTETAQQQALEEQVFQQTEREMLETLDKYDIPKSQQTIYMMAEVARMNLEHGLELTPAQMAHEVKGRMQDLHQNMTRGLKGESLVKYLGDDVVREILRFKVEQARGKGGQVAQPQIVNEDTEADTEPPSSKPAPKSQGPMTYSERKKFFKRF